MLGLDTPCASTVMMRAITLNVNTWCSDYVAHLVSRINNTTYFLFFFALSRRSIYPLDSSLYVVTTSVKRRMYICEDVIVHFLALPPPSLRPASPLPRARFQHDAR